MSLIEYGTCIVIAALISGVAWLYFDSSEDYPEENDNIKKKG